MCFVLKITNLITQKRMSYPEVKKRLPKKWLTYLKNIESLTCSLTWIFLLIFLVLLDIGNLIFYITVFFYLLTEKINYKFYF